MKRKSGKRTELVSGAILFFTLIALVIQIAVLLYEYIRERTDNKALIAVLMLGVIVILSAFCMLSDVIRRRIMIDRPVSRILAATERIAKGDFSTRLEITHAYGKYNEYDLIAENLNAMAEALSKSEILKTDFISNVSHELKTPLSVIGNYAQLLQAETDETLRRKYAETLVDASKRLSLLITNILKLNKLENQSLEPEYAETDLTALLSEVVIGYEEQVERKDLNLVCDLEDVKLYTSAGLLEIVFNNLLSNAVKFTDAGGRIEITLQKRPNGALVRVSDSGCGISPETGARIFEKFYQCDTSHAQEGNGLGLALVKRVIDILGGEINVESELGKGTAFTLVLKGIEKNERSV